MLFNNYRFKVVEINLEKGTSVVHYHRGTKKAVMKDVEYYKNNCKRWEMVGKNGMIVWVG